MRAALQPSFLGWFWRICPFADLDQHPPERPIFRDNEPACSLAVWACVIPPSVMQHAVLLGRDSWMRFNTRSYRAHRVFGELTLSRLPEPATEHDRRGSMSLTLLRIALYTS